MDSKTLETKVNAALVFRGDFSDVQMVKEMLVDAGVEIIYQRMAPSGTKLYIKEGDHGK